MIMGLGSNLPGIFSLNVQVEYVFIDPAKNSESGRIAALCNNFLTLFWTGGGANLPLQLFF